MVVTAAFEPDTSRLYDIPSAFFGVDLNSFFKTFHTVITSCLFFHESLT